MTLAHRSESANLNQVHHSSETSNSAVEKTTPLAAIQEYAKKAFQREMKRTNGEAVTYSIPVMNYPMPETIQGEEYVLQRRIQLLAQILGAMSDTGHGIEKFVVRGAHFEDLPMLVELQGAPKETSDGIMHSVIFTLDSIDALDEMYSTLQGRANSAAA
jgi:hypothetical protein